MTDISSLSSKILVIAFFILAVSFSLAINVNQSFYFFPIFSISAIVSFFITIITLIYKGRHWIFDGFIQLVMLAKNSFKILELALMEKSEVNEEQRDYEMKKMKNSERSEIKEMMGHPVAEEYAENIIKRRKEVQMDKKEYFENLEKFVKSSYKKKKQY